MFLHRLNRVEYNNTVHDLLGTSLSPADAFPQDSGGDGSFNNNEASLTLAPSLMDLYLSAAETLAAEASNPNSAAYHTLVSCDPNAAPAGACLHDTVARLVTRAWRRPISDTELSKVMAVAQGAGASFSEQLEGAVIDVLVSPKFLFRVEGLAQSNTSGGLDDYEMASRLSYFLWRTMPDDVLIDAAAKHALSADADLTAQLSRMMADPRAKVFLADFFGQWLRLDSAAAFVADPNVYPSFDPNLVPVFTQETNLFLADMFQSGRPISDILTADFSYINDALAHFYGLQAPGSITLQRVTLPAASHRGGLLTQAAILTATSPATRTSPVRRGDFVLTSLLCTPPPAPPADIPSLPAAGTVAGTQRQILSEHVTNPACAGCHDSIDPLGFALEEYDATGKYRTMDAGLPVDTTGTLAGTAFTDAVSMEQVLASGQSMVNCVSQRMFSYALGRSITSYDQTSFTGLTAQMHNNGSTWPSLVQAIVLSPSFRTPHPEVSP